MSYSINNREDLEKLEGLASLQNQAKVVRLQDKFGKQNFHEDIEKVFEPVTKPLDNTLETSIKNKQAIENLNNKLLEIMNDRGITATYLLSPLSKITNPENSGQFKLVKVSKSNRVKGFLIHNTIPITLRDNLLTFPDSDKTFELKGDLFEMITSKK